VNLRYIDWIWNVRGSLALAPGQSNDDAFNRLAPLFRETGTSHERTNDTLTFRKKDPVAQDKMSVFDDGALRVERSMAGSILRYQLTSRILLLCFLAPLFFLGVAQLTIAIGKFQKASTEAAAGKASDASKKAAKDKKDKVVPLNPIDKFLGAPEPEKPKKDKKDKDGAGGRDKKPTPTPAYVFAGIFAALYVIGRILEDRLVKGLFRKSLLGT
jgi:hypothetical protein